MTVEGRERYPVRVRYARAFRDDVEALKRILVSARGPDAGKRRRHGTVVMSEPPPRPAPPTPPLQVPLAEVADVRWSKARR